MIDLKSEALLTMAQAARLRPLGRGGRPTHPSTIYRWISRGVRGFRLEGIRLGGTLYTSREALQRFAEKLTKDLKEAVVKRTSAGSRPAAEAANNALAGFGY